MTGCAGFRDQMLAAEMAVLRAEGSSDLAAHLRVCPHCAEVAEALLTAHAELGGVLERASESNGDAGPSERRPPAARDSRARRGLRHGARWLPLAAAAALVAVLALPGPGPTPERTPPARRPVPPAVEAPAGSNVAVMPTANPDITVVWFF